MTPVIRNAQQDKQLDEMLSLIGKCMHEVRTLQKKLTGECDEYVKNADFARRAKEAIVKFCGVRKQDLLEIYKKFRMRFKFAPVADSVNAIDHVAIKSVNHLIKKVKEDEEEIRRMLAVMAG